MNYYYFYYKSNIKLWSTNWIITPFPFHHRRTQWLADWLTDIGDTRELRSPLAASVWLLLLCSVADTLYHQPGEAGLAPGKTSEHYTRSSLYNIDRRTPHCTITYSDMRKKWRFPLDNVMYGYLDNKQFYLTTSWPLLILTPSNFTLETFTENITMRHLYWERIRSIKTIYLY